MRRQIVFGDGWVEADFPDDIQVVPPGISTSMGAAPDIGREYRTALTDPIDLPPLRELARGKSRVVVAFDDATVPCYAPVWSTAMPLILEELEGAGVSPSNIEFICANALHRKFTLDEIASWIGEDFVKQFGDQVHCHDAENDRDIVELGTTASGYYVDLNRSAVEADLVVYLNCSTTRGFSGGWKSICVGLSTYRSIAHHHTPDIMSMSLDRNPMHEILDEMGEVVTSALGREHFFKIETVLANPIQVARAFGGSVDATRKAAIDLNKAHMSNRRDLLPERVDTVVYGVPDWSPYAAFSFTNPLLTLISTGLGYLGGMIEALGKPGCTAILATPCPDRWDQTHHPSYKEVWERILPTSRDPDEIRAVHESEFAHREDYIEKYRNEFGFHGVHGIMALYPLKRLRHAGRVIVAGAEDPSIPKHAGFETATTVEEAISDVSGASIALVEYPPGFNRA